MPDAAPAAALGRPPAHRVASDLAQLRAVLRKNFLLRTSSSSGGSSSSGRRFLSRSACGWLGLSVEVGLPVLFFLIAALPRFYVAPTPLPRQFFPHGSLESLSWVMEYYKGPGAASETGATVLFSPNNTQARELMELTAKGLKCGGAQRGGLQSVPTAPFIQTFPDLFPLPGGRQPVECSTKDSCLSTPACYQPLLERQFEGFPTEEQALQRALANPQSVDAIVAFRDIDADDGRYSYDIRVNHSMVPDTRARLSRLPVRPGYQYRQYWFFCNLQQYVNRAIIGAWTGNGSAPSEVAFGVKPYPWPATVVNFAVFISGGFFKLLMVLAFLPQVRTAVVTIVQEKELRLREGMRTLGLRDEAYWAAWAVTHFTTLFLSGAGCALVGTYSFPHTSLSVMLLFYALSSLALVAFSYFLSTLFSTQRVAGLATIICFAAAMLPGFLLPTLIQPYGGLGWTLACLLPPSAITMMVECILSSETVQRGVTWQTLGVSAAVEYSFSPAQLFVILAFDIALYALLTWYCDQVMPSEWGQRRQWYFIFSRSYWASMLSVCTTKSSDAGLQEHLLPGGRVSHNDDDDDDDDDDDGGGDGIAVRIRGLNKSFRCSDGTVKQAVKDLSLDIHRDQITALLGHNGAGKTTTISILTGMLPATSGTAIINNMSVDHDMPKIRRSLGLCPQFDILWPTISVWDHLWLYATIKGLSGESAAEAVFQAAQDVGLMDKMDFPAGELSGGDARKLSVAIAFMGRPAIVFLDEPTSAMDPFSRRFTWDLIRRNREGCAIVLTTHDMEEADVLSDSIAILKSGHLAAAGSALELKSSYGAGYVLHILTAGVPASCPATGEALHALVAQHVPGAAVLSHTGAQLSFRLPKDASRAFAGLLRELRERQEDLRVSSYGLGITTLEEVFLHVTNQKDYATDVQACSPLPVSTLSTTDQPTAEAVAVESAWHLYWRKTAALLYKRVRCSRRDWGSTAAQLGVPLLLLVAAVYARTAAVRVDQLPRMPITQERSGFSLPTALSVSSEAQQDEAAVAAFLRSYPHTELLPTGTSSMQDWFHPANGTLDDWLLLNWYAADNHTYEALFVERLLLSNGSSGVDGSALTVLVNETAYHALPLAINQASNALLRMVAGPKAAIEISSHPMPALPTELSEQIDNAAGNLLLVLLTLLAMAGLSASFSAFLVSEATSSSKLVQLVAGAPRLGFWIANYVFDFGMSCTVLFATVLLFSLSGLPGLSGGNAVALCALLIAFGLSAIPLTYCLHFLYTDEMEALQGINTLLTTVGILGFLIVWILESIYNLLLSPRILKVATGMKLLLRIVSPHFCLGQGIYQLAYAGGGNPWDPAISGRYLRCMLLQACAFFTVTVGVELLSGRQGALLASLQNHLHTSQDEGGRSHEDGEASQDGPLDLAEERRHAQNCINGTSRENQLVMAGAGRIYSRGLFGRPLHAVRDMWLAVGKSECVGLLGVSGAGKTTSFKVAVGELPLTSGDVVVCGHSITTDLNAARPMLGYCPQADPLLPLLTATELLTLFATLRGVPARDIASVVTGTMHMLGFEEYAHRVCGSFSGGNKRKLSVGTALVGQPPVMLLDEPSAGLDPGARHFLWAFISGKVVSDGRTVLLTSQSMEECEVLCNRIAIMAAGTLQCIGTPQQLKARFAKGYNLELRFGSEVVASDMDAAAGRRFLTELEAAGTVVERDARHVIFHLPMCDLPSVFEGIETHSSVLGITDYALNQTTLEHVFLHVTEGQGEQ